MRLESHLLVFLGTQGKGKVYWNARLVTPVATGMFAFGNYSDRFLNHQEPR